MNLEMRGKVSSTLTHTHIIHLLTWAIHQDEAPQAALADATAGFGGFGIRCVFRYRNFVPAVGKMTGRYTRCSPKDGKQLGAQLITRWLKKSGRQGNHGKAIFQQRDLWNMLHWDMHVVPIHEMYCIYNIYLYIISPDRRDSRMAILRNWPMCWVPCLR